MPAVGTVIEPGEEWNLVLIVTPTANPASLDGFKIFYEDSSGKRFVESTPGEDRVIVTNDQKHEED